MLAGNATAQSVSVERVPPQTELNERLAAIESVRDRING